MRFRYRALLLGVVTASILIGWSGVARAAETASSELVIIREGDVVEDDLYAVGVRVIIEGVVEGDLIAFAAEEVSITGRVGGSVLAVAPVIDVAGEIGDSMRMSGNRFALSGSIGQDLVGATLQASLDPGSSVGGDVMVWSLILEAGGEIAEDLTGTQRESRLAGSVRGEVDVTAGSLTVTGPLEVGGDLGYRSASEASGLGEATVGGVIVHKTPLPPNIRVRALGLVFRVLVVIALTATALLVAWGWPARVEHSGRVARSQSLRAFGYGLIVMLSPVLLVLIAILVGRFAPATASFPLLVIFAPLVLATSGVVLVLSLFAGVPTVVALGRALPGELGLHGAILAGAGVVGLVWLLPWIGWVVPLLALPLGLGAWMLGFRASPAQMPE